MLDYGKVFPSCCRCLTMSKLTCACGLLYHVVTHLSVAIALQVGSPLPAPVPVAAPAPEGRDVIARVLNSSSVPAHAPVALPQSQITAVSSHKGQGAAAHAAHIAQQEPGPPAQAPVPGQAQLLPAPAPAPASPSSSAESVQTPPAAMTTPPDSARDAMSYIFGGR